MTIAIVGLLIGAALLFAGGYATAAARTSTDSASVQAALDAQDASTERQRELEAAAARHANERAQLEGQRQAAQGRLEEQGARLEEQGARLQQLQQKHAARQAELESARQQLGAQQAASQALEAQRDEARSRAAQASAQLGRLQGELTTAKARIAGLEAERATRNQMQALLKPLVQGQPDAKALEAKLVQQMRDHEQKLLGATRQALQPLTRWQRVAEAFARLTPGESRDQLGAFLDIVAARGGFKLVVLSDAQGLVVASSASGASGHADARAGISSLLLPVVEASAKQSEPVPLAVLLRDAENQAVVTRILRSADSPFLLTAVSTGAAGQHMPTDVLDPLVDKIENLLTDWTVAS